MLKKVLLSIVLSSLFSCSNQQEQNDTPKQHTPIYQKAENAITFNRNFASNISKEISNRAFVPMEKLQSDKIKNIEENSNITVSKTIGKEMNGNEMYFYLKERTFIIGSAYLCNQCPETHVSHATAFAITSDGVLMTNYHVIETNENTETKAIFVTDSEGNVYNVTSILAASQSNDLAIIKIDTKGEKLKHIPFAKEELLGEDIYLMGHPFNQNYFMSKGIISRKYINVRDDEPRLAVSAEFGQGSSGGPFVNTRGELVAMVAGTYSNYAMEGDRKGYLQMLTREVIPVSTMWNYVKN